MNNLTDITLDRRYSSICGYTEADLDTVFAPELAGLDRQQVREWYNGYRWRGDEKVYNPYDVLLLLRGREFDAHWFETGTPAFLVDTLFERRVSSVSLGEMVSTGELLSAFDVEHIGTEALLFQTGYLTRYAARRCRRTNNDIADYEGFYASVFYSYFASLGYEIAVEESSSHGRLDMAVRTGGHVYLFEFKVVEMAPPGSALAQLQERRYADKYRARGEPIHLIGVEFSRDTRNVTAFEVAGG